MDTKQASLKFNVGTKEIQELCRKKLIIGARKEKGKWIIPDDTKFIIDYNGIKYILWEIFNFKIDKNYAFSLKYIETPLKVKECIKYLQSMGYVTSFEDKECIEDIFSSIRLSQRAIEELKCSNIEKQSKIYFCENFTLIKLK